MMLSFSVNIFFSVTTVQFLTSRYYVNETGISVKIAVTVVGIFTQLIEVRYAI